MRIAILTSGILPVPAVQGGAVENLIDFYLDYNNRHRLHDITVYSVWHPDVKKHQAVKSDVNHYKYINVSDWWAKIEKKIYQKTHGQEYYHYTIEYFLHKAMKDICRKQYDIIIMENRPGYALKIQNITDAKLVYHLHNEKLSNIIQQNQDIYDAAFRILSVSNFIKSRVQTINPADDKTLTVYNGINLNAFNRTLVTPPTRADLKKEDFLIIYSFI